MKRTPFKRSTKPLKRTRLKMRGVSDASVLKEQIQHLLREIALVRDKTCVLNDEEEAGKCGGYRKDGALVLQFDHLNSRTHAISFSDSRLGVLVCKRHHLYYKKQYPAQYEKLVRKAIGKARCELLDKVRADHKPYKVDLKLAIVGLTQELNKLLDQDPEVKKLRNLTT